MAFTSPNIVTTGEARLSYLDVFQPRVPLGGGDPKYSVTVLVPKTDIATKQAIDAAIEAAIKDGISKCWNGQRPPQPAICVHDGDGPRPSDQAPYSAECRGHWVFTASSKNQPAIVDENIQPILNQNDVYSGMYGRVNVTFFPYNNGGKKGVGCGLNCVQKTRDGEPFISRVTAEAAFGMQSQNYNNAQTYGAQNYNNAQTYGAQYGQTSAQYEQAPAQSGFAPQTGYGQSVNPFTGQAM